MASFLEPMKLDNFSFTEHHCDKLDTRAMMVDAYAILRDAPPRSYVVSNPCIRPSNAADERAICGLEGTNRESACRMHYQNLVYLADTGKINVKDLKDLKRDETNIAYIPENIYWKLIQKDMYPARRKEFFVNKVDKGSAYVKEKIHEDLTIRKVETRKKLLDFVKCRVGNLTSVNFKKESKRYSFASNVTEVLQALELIANPDMDAMMLENNEMGWYIYAKTRWGDDNYFVMCLEDNHASAGLIGSETRFDSGVVSLIEEDIDKIVNDEELISPGNAFARIANGLDDIRWKHHTGKNPVEA